MAFYELVKKQIVPATIDEVGEFISSPKNLKEITPDYMGFDIKSKNLDKKMYPEMSAGIIFPHQVFEQSPVKGNIKAIFLLTAIFLK